MSFVWILFIVLLLWLLFKSFGNNPTDNVIPQTVIDENYITEYQTEFEKRLSENIDLPDAVHDRDVCIYKKLMSPWYEKLLAKFRYDSSKIQKIREDWVDYMESLEHIATYSFLSLESDTEEARNAYEEDHTMAYRKASSIENAFAEYIGEEAIKELKNIRQLDLTRINSKGEIAPEGFIFDLNGKLIEDPNNIKSSNSVH